MMTIELEGGKYSLIQTEGGRQVAFRYGEPWQDFTGDKFVAAMANRITELEAENADLRAKLAEAERDAGRLDHLQQQGATVSLHVMPTGADLGFVIGGLRSTINHSVRDAIDAARKGAE